MAWPAFSELWREYWNCIYMSDFAGYTERDEMNQDEMLMLLLVFDNVYPVTVHQYPYRQMVPTSTTTM